MASISFPSQGNKQSKNISTRVHIMNEVKVAAFI